MIDAAHFGATLTSVGKDAPAFTRQGAGFVLLVVRGHEAGRFLRVQAPVTLGSDPAADLLLTDPTVSRQHLRAEPREGVLALRDLGSKNGSFLADEAFETAEVKAGAEVRIGDTVFKVLPLEEAVEPKASNEERFGGLIGNAPAMRQLFTMLERIAPTEASILLEGETGVGKEVVAEEIHRRSPRAKGPFVIFDCGAVPEDLIESALFGHKKGAFTGATSANAGIFAEADGGTVFLDEIGELDISLQPALLRVLDRGMIRAVGASEYQTVNVRVVAATHRNLGQQILSGGFREDLYYRLAVVRMAVPPLRERMGDIPTLVRHFLGRLGRPDVGIEEAALAELASHTWPGNVRELRNIVERTLVLSPDGRFSLEGLHVGGGLSRRPNAAKAAASGPRQAFRDAKAIAIEAFEREYLTSLMADYDSLTAAANGADMDRKQLRTLLRRHGLKDD